VRISSRRAGEPVDGAAARRVRRPRIHARGVAHRASLSARARAPAMATAKYKWTRAEEDALRDGVRKHGPGKWRTIQKDPELGDILRARSNVDLKDKWRNLRESGALDAADATGGAEEEREASDREHAEGGGKRRRRDGDEAETSNAKGKENAMDAVTNALFNETQRVKREASAAEAAASAAEAHAARCEREAWEAEKLARELIDEAQRQKVGIPVEGTVDVADVAADLLEEE